MEDDPDYSYQDRQPTEEKHRSNTELILQNLKAARQQGMLGLVKSELKEVTGLTETKIESSLVKLASQGKISFRDFPDPKIVDIKKPAVRVWYVRR